MGPPTPKSPTLFSETPSFIKITITMWRLLKALWMLLRSSTKLSRTTRKVKLFSKSTPPCRRWMAARERSQESQGVLLQRKGRIFEQDDGEGCCPCHGPRHDGNYDEAELDGNRQHVYVPRYRLCLPRFRPRPDPHSTRSEVQAHAPAGHSVPNHGPHLRQLYVLGFPPHLRAWRSHQPGPLRL